MKPVSSAHLIVLFLLMFVALQVVACTIEKPLDTLSTSVPMEGYQAGDATATAETVRWIEYENALAKAFLPSPGKGLCEWEILGQSGNEVYVWAICQEAYGTLGAAMSAPAVIELTTDKTIVNVRVPGSGSLYGSDIRKLFPVELHDKIFSHSIDIREMDAHIKFRHENPEPPLVVLSGVVLP